MLCWTLKSNMLDFKAPGFSVFPWERLAEESALIALGHSQKWSMDIMITCTFIFWLNSQYNVSLFVVA